MTQPTVESVTGLLNALAAARATIDGLNEQLELKQRQLVPEEIRNAMQGIRDEMAPRIASAEKEAEELEEKAKTATIDLKQTVRGSRLMAVYTGPKPKWDEKALEGYALAHPEILALKSESKPSVAIRTR